MTPCKFNNCSKKPAARGLCPGHYQQQRRGVALTPLKKQGRTPKNMTTADRRRWEKYHLHPEQFQKMIAEQGGKCAICRTDDPGRDGDWHVDHDHSCCDYNGSCGKCVRGLLCLTCNIGLGSFHDNKDHLQSAVAYLSRYL